MKDWKFGWCRYRVWVRCGEPDKTKCADCPVLNKARISAGKWRHGERDAE